MSKLQGFFLTLLPLVFCTRLDDAVEAPKLAFCLFVLALSWARGGLSGRFPARPLAVCVGGWWLVTTAVWWTRGLSGGGREWLEVTVGLGFTWLWLSGRVGRPADWAPAVAWGWWATVAYSWIQRLGLDPIGWSRPDLSQERTIAGLGNPNYLGFYLALLAPLIWVLCQRQPASRRFPAWGLNVAWSLGVLAVVMTATRASWLALAAACLVMGVGIWRWHRSLRRPFLGTLALLVVMTPAVYRLRISATEDMTVSSRFHELLSSQNVSNQTRLMLWRAALLEIREKPVLGWGEGWFPYRALLHRDVEPMLTRPLQRRPENSHNHYLDVCFSSGLIGLAFYCACGWVAFRQAWTRAATDPQGLAILAGLTAYAVNSTFIGATITTRIMVLWMAAAVDSPPAECGPPEKWLGRVGAVLLGICAAAIVACESFLWRGDDLMAAFKERHLVAPEVVTSQALQEYRRAALCAPPWRRKLVAQKLLISNSPANLRALTSLCQSYPEDGFLWAALAGESERQVGHSEVNPQLITRMWSAAIATDPYNPVFRLHASRWLWRTGDFSGALREIERSLEIF